jgi:hypothetical protein
MRLSFFSTRAAQEAQVIPPMASSTSAVGACAPVGVVVLDMLSPGRGPDRTGGVGARRYGPAGVG